MSLLGQLSSSRVGSPGPGNQRDFYLSDEGFSRLSPYMTSRYGMTEEDYSREEIVDSFINKMRSYTSGNSVTTVAELAYLNSATAEERQIAGETYRLWDETPGVFSEGGGTFMERADAAFDYTWSLAADPVNLLSLGVGKLAARGATKAGTELLVPIAKEAAEAVVRSPAGRNLTGRALEQARREAYQTSIAKTMQSAGYRESTRRAARSEIVGATGFDAVAAAGLDGIYQTNQILAGVQSEYSPLQSTFATIGGLTGGVLPVVFNTFRGVSKTPLASLHIERSLEVLAKREEEAMRAANVNLAPEKVAAAMNKERFKELTKAMREKLTSDWAERKRRGNSRFAREGATTFNDVLYATFLLGDREEGIVGLKDIMLKSGLPAFSKRSEGDTYTNWMFDVLKAAGLQDEVKQVFDNTIGKFFVSDQPVEFEDIVGLSSEAASFAGRSLNFLSQLARMNKKVTEVISGKRDNVTAQELMDEIAADLGETFDEEATGGVMKGFTREKVSKSIEGMQNNLIRMLVTHPGTTYLNVAGWAQASFFQSVSDTLRGTLYATSAGLNKLIGRELKATEYRNLAGQMFDLQRKKVVNLLDPYGTYESVADYLSFRPKARNELLRYLSGGIEASEFQKVIGLAPDEIVTPSKFEGILDTLQYMYGVQAQDLFTKTQEFMYSLDRQIRIKYGKSYAEFIKSDESAEYLTKKGTAAFQEFAEIEAVAVEDALRNVFAKRYGGNKGTLSAIAKMVEDARKYPVIGALIPFGQFFNNTLGFMMDHTGISLLHKAVVGTDRNLLDLVTKSAIGISTLGVMTAKQMQMMEDGLAWNQERDSNGALMDKAYDFPGSFFDFAGRLFAHDIVDGQIPPELFEQFMSTFGPEALSQGLDDSIETAKNMVYSFLSMDTDAVGVAVADAVKASSQMYISGFTRFADPFNQMAALLRGEDYVGVDRNQEAAWFNKSFRYVDQFIEAAVGGPLAPQKYTATGGEQNRVPIGRIFGLRELPAQTTVQRMFADIGRPEWMTQIMVDDPAVANRVNQVIFPVLEGYAEQLIEMPSWRSASLEDRIKLVDSVLTLARGDTLDILEASSREGDDKIATIFEIERQTGASRKERDEIMAIFNVEEDKLNELDLPQLQIILHYLKNASARTNLLKAQFGLQ